MSMNKCALGCGRTDDDIGKCGSFLTCSGAVEAVVPGVDVILTITDVDGTDTVRCINPLDVLRGKSRVEGFNTLSENAKVTAKVLPVATPVVEPEFVPEVATPILDPKDDAPVLTQAMLDTAVFTPAGEALKLPVPKQPKAQKPPKAPAKVEPTLPDTQAQMSADLESLAEPPKTEAPEATPAVTETVTTDGDKEA